METAIGGVCITQLDQITDDRGTLLHMMRCDAPEFTKFGECYFSEVLPGAIKAWKKHSKQTQNFAVPMGRIRLVVYDDRPKSMTQGKTLVMILGRPDAYFRLRIPPQLWYGFTCISELPALLVNCSDLPHVPSESEVLVLDDKFIPYSWDIEMTGE